MNKAQKIAKQVNDSFVESVHDLMLDKFGIEIETGWSLLDMVYTSNKADGTDFTIEQINYLAGISDGYATAMNKIQ